MAHAIRCLVLLLCIQVAHAADTDPNADIKPHLAKSRTAVKNLGITLKAQLLSAMKAGGPNSALSVCNITAPTLTQAVSNKFSGDVGRTALKLRNPKNAPDAWERKGLENFIAQLKAGADPKTLEYFDVVSADGQKTFRYMKPIMTGPPCLTCHGPTVAPSLRKKILELYPQDAAVGFSKGSLRGAFTVTLPMK